ncbi:MAG: glycoside hydrolase family 97 catalytic domain-containing protein [Chitinispirillaceae bacterium]|nr:glycoside hydrolase family 97 catalytic domain-containing protein [Chitinispirillaceae bacterium]
MKRTGSAAIILFAATLSLVFGASQSTWTIVSPGDKVKATVQLADLGGEADYPAAEVRLYYTVSAGGPGAYSTVVLPSPMGLVRSDRNFVSGLTFVSEGAQRTIDSTYTMVTGKRSVCRNYCNEKMLSFQTTEGNSKIDLYLRAYDDGFAFRYRFPETNASPLSVTGEATGFRVPANSVMWMVAYNNTVDQYAPAYEDIWKRNLEAGAGIGTTAKPSDSTWCMPALYRTPAGCWALLWESDVTPSYCCCRLSNKADKLVYRITFPNPSEVMGLGSVNPSSTLPWTMPWRVIITGTSPGTILESTLSTDLATPSMVSDVSWIRPGRASWSWWSDNNSSKNYNLITPFIDLAQQMTWEYSTVDVDWHKMTNGTWRQLAAYAAEKDVGLILWYNGGGPINTITGGPRDSLYDSTTRNNQFQTISAAGVKGVKIDFWLSDKQNIVKYYFDVFRDAAKYRLLVDPHGCTVPRGWQRTYPNLITAEANRGAENYIWFPEDGDRFPWQNTILPFTRNAVGSMDWTPVTFTNVSNPHKTSYGHELALSVVFESGIQHFADRVSGYQTPTITAEVQTFLKEVPVVWDDTKYMQGYPGSWVVIARRKGYDWYAAGIAGDTARTMAVKLSFLQDAPASYHLTLITDGSSEKTFSETTDTVGSADSLRINTLVRGGWVAKFVDLNPSVVHKTVVAGSGTNRPRAGCSVVAGESFVLPNSFTGENMEISVYCLDGRLKKRATTESRILDLKRNFNLPGGVYIVRFGYH